MGNDLLDTVFLVVRASAWGANLSAKAVKTPKAYVTDADFRHLRWLRDRLGDRFVGGYVVHLGAETGSFSDGMAVLPLSAMWHHHRI